jgi:hypothetical protein
MTQNTSFVIASKYICKQMCNSKHNDPQLVIHLKRNKNELHSLHFGAVMIPQWFGVAQGLALQYKIHVF